jgi:hypothetical protein
MHRHDCRRNTDDALEDTELLLSSSSNDMQLSTLRKNVL